MPACPPRPSRLERRGRRGEANTVGELVAAHQCGRVRPMKHVAAAGRVNDFHGKGRQMARARGAAAEYQQPSSPQVRTTACLSFDRAAAAAVDRTPPVSCRANVDGKESNDRLAPADPGKSGNVASSKSATTAAPAFRAMRAAQIIPRPRNDPRTAPGRNEQLGRGHLASAPKTPSRS